MSAGGVSGLGCGIGQKAADVRGVSFTVAGVPAPQGSKTRTKWGMREDNAATRPWREAVAWCATDAMMGTDGRSRVLEVLPPLEGPLALEVSFYFPRPKSHFGTGKNAGVEKATAPRYVTAKPDLDKLLRAIGDALAGIVCRDDSQFVNVRAEKLYGTPRAVIEARELYYREVAA